MGILQRITMLARANINALLDKAEDPEVMIEQILRDMKESYHEAKVQVTAAITEEKKLKQKAGENADLAARWMQKAELAVNAGDDDLAREALKRKQDYDGMAKSFQAQWEEQVKAVTELKEALTELESKIAEAERKKDMLIARSKRAKATKQIHETMAGISKNSAFEAFDRMEDKVEHTEAQAQAAKEVDTDTLEEKFARLEGDRNVDDELSALKTRLKKDA